MTPITRTTATALALVPDTPAPARPVLPADQAWTLPHGRVVPREARGIYWARVLVGQSRLCYLVDSAGDSRGIWRAVPADAPASEYVRVERELLALLNTLDPLPAPALTLG